jgi:phosphate starvation-inducible membrane PsiE
MMFNMRYLLYIIACILILASWFWGARAILPLLSKKGYKITKIELYGLLFILFLVMLALIATYLFTNGTFRWR